MKSKPAGSARMAQGAAALAARKAELRRELLARRRAIPPDLKETTHWKIANHLRAVCSSFSPTVVAGYAPRGSEVDIFPWLTEWHTAGNQVALPRVVAPAHPLVFNAWHPGMALEPDALGIPCASGEELTPSLVVIPCVAYSKTGHRLGYGGGYYDRTLKQLNEKTRSQGVRAIGVCYTELEITEDIWQYHDYRLDVLITGKEIIEF